MSTTLNEAREAIYQRFVTAWENGGSPLSLYTLDNEQWDEPEGRTAWVRLSVRHRSRGQETLGAEGNRKFASKGAAYVQVFVPKDSGRKTADDLATSARDIFEGVRIAGTTVRFLDVDVRETGPDGRWDQTVVEATFEYDETK